MRIGLFGGAFDPPTIGHLETAKQVLAHAPDIENLWLMPSRNHNFGKNMTDPAHRLRMCELASEGIPGLFISEFEINSQSDGRTFNSVTEIMSAHPEHEFVWIIGSDNALVFHKWYAFEQLRDIIPFIVVPRPDYELADLPSSMTSRVKPHRIVGQDSILISSTKIRDLFKTGQYNEAQRWLCPQVFNYIMEHKLYGTDNAIKRN